ncbi:MAG: anthranilate phosphoribosyltransferase, partial [Chloroflexi bacterium]|nr:anthranilate phosphoribosyltransferase [Chloroflexota bacterium]
FNISTAAAFVVAGAGLRVAKHGNRAASGQCGSADVLEAFGVKIDLGPEGVKRCIEEVGIGFMFAPAFHPSMRHAAPVRREIGIRTVFNFLGPLTNPAGVQVQVIGVPNAAMAEKLAQALLRLGTTRRALVVHGQDGLDEITLTGPTLVWELNRGSLAQYPIDPVTLGLRTTRLQALKGGDVATNKSIMAAVLQGQKGPARDVVLLNAAAALMAAEAARDLKNGLALAATAIDSGEAYGKLQALATLSQTLK